MTTIPYWLNVAITIIMSIWTMVELLVFIVVMTHSKAKYNNFGGIKLIAYVICACLWFSYKLLA